MNIGELLEPKKDVVEAKLVSPLTPLMDIKPEVFTDPNLASEFHKRLVKMINAFNDSIDQDHDVGLQLCNFGQKVTIYIEDIGYYNPSLIHFYGFDMDTKNNVELIQHVSQINILLVKLPRLNPEQPKRPIGFNAEK